MYFLISEIQNIFENGEYKILDSRKANTDRDSICNDCQEDNRGSIFLSLLLDFSAY